MWRPTIFNGCIFANHLQRDEYLVDRIVADGFFRYFGVWLEFGWGKSAGFRLVEPTTRLPARRASSSWSLQLGEREADPNLSKCSIAR